MVELLGVNVYFLPVYARWPRMGICQPSQCRSGLRFAFFFLLIFQTPSSPAMPVEQSAPCVASALEFVQDLRVSMLFCSDMLRGMRILNYPMSDLYHSSERSTSYSNFLLLIDYPKKV